VRIVLVIAFAACAHAAPRERVERTAPTAPAAPTAGEWVDLETMSVDLATRRVRPRAPDVAPALEDGRLEVTHANATTTVRDLEQRGAAMTFEESVRWVGGYLWSSGDVLVSSERRLARIELASTDPRYVGNVVWELPPLAGSRGTAVLIGPRDASPIERPKHVAFAGYEPSGDAPVEVALVEALARDVERARVVGPSPCSRREVRLLEGPPLVVVVACPEGAVVERPFAP
jgi:hypothetical protein